MNIFKRKKKTRPSIGIFDKLSTVRREIKFVFFTSLISILLIETCLKNYPAYSNLVYVSGEVYLRICYSLIAASMFFIINQHLPKENRNIKIHRFVGNKFAHVTREVSWLLATIGLEKNKLDFDEEQISAALKKINPNSLVIESGFNQFDNWIKYLRYKIEVIKKLLDDILVLNSSLESDLLENLTNIHDSLNVFFIYGENAKINYGQDLSYFSYSIHYLVEETLITHKLLSSERYKKYRMTNMNEYKKRKPKKQ